MACAAAPSGSSAAPIIRRVPETVAPRLPDRAVDPAPTDEALLAAYAGGDAAAFPVLYARHERAVYRFLLRSLGNAAAADDLLQDVWLAVVRNAGRFEPRAKFTTWLYGIARNRLIDHWRARRDTVSLDAAANDPDRAPSDDIAAEATAQPEVQAVSRAHAAAFVAAVEALPGPQREAFLLHAEGGLTVEEVAQLTGVGRETAKSRLRYALGKLRSALREWR